MEILIRVIVRIAISLVCFIIGIAIGIVYEQRQELKDIRRN